MGHLIHSVAPPRLLHDGQWATTVGFALQQLTKQLRTYWKVRGVHSDADAYRLIIMVIVVDSFNCRAASGSITCNVWSSRDVQRTENIINTLDHRCRMCGYARHTFSSHRNCISAMKTDHTLLTEFSLWCILCFYEKAPISLDTTSITDEVVYKWREKMLCVWPLLICFWCTDMSERLLQAQAHTYAPIYIIKSLIKHTCIYKTHPRWEKQRTSILLMQIHWSHVEYILLPVLATPRGGR